MAITPQAVYHKPELPGLLVDRESFNPPLTCETEIEHATTVEGPNTFLKGRDASQLRVTIRHRHLRPLRATLSLTRW
eukprot:5845216-Pyramimonas_sp.AAC.1